MSHINKFSNTMARRRFLKACAVGTASTAICLTRAENNQLKPLAIGNETQLFLDDWIIAENKGMKRVLHQPVKKGLLKYTDGKTWDRGPIYVGNIAYRDPKGLFHMTYRYFWDDPSVKSLSSNIGEDKAHWFRESTAYAYSEDGIHWHRPKLGLVDGPAEFKKEGPYQVAARMSKENNLGVPFDFIYDLHAHGNITDPKKHFLLRVVKKDDTHPFAKIVESQLCYASEWPDFYRDPNWREKLTPIPGGKLSPRGTPTLVGFDHGAGVWFSVWQDHIGNWKKRGGRDIARWETKDFLSWSGPKLVLPIAPDESKDPADTVEYMALDAYRVGGTHSGVWLGQLCVFHSDRTDPEFQMPTIAEVWRKGTTELRLVCSRDAGHTWQRVCGKQTWLPYHPEEHGYDRLVFAQCPIRVGDELWLYYSGYDGDHLTYKRDGSFYYKNSFIRTGRSMLATMRWDGYVSMDADGSGAEMLTNSVVCQGTKLKVNLASPNGELRVEIQDETGRAVPGFSLADCVPLHGDGVALPVKWKANANLAEMKGKPVRLRFVSKNSALYSFQLQA